MPRALTEQEKCGQCKKLLEKGRAAVFSQGVRKVSIDEITKAAGMAKGSFYQHFESKETYLCALIESVHRQAFKQAEQMLRDGHDLRADARGFLRNLFQMPENVFLIQNHREISALFDAVPNQALQSFKQMEAGLFEGVLRLAGIDTARVKPGVVHNCVHALYMMMASDLMTAEDLPESTDLILDGLIAYIFGGAR